MQVTDRYRPFFDLSSWKSLTSSLHTPSIHNTKEISIHFGFSEEVHLKKSKMILLVWYQTTYKKGRYCSLKLQKRAGVSWAVGKDLSEMFFRTLRCSTLCVYNARAFGTPFLESQQSEEELTFSELFHMRKNLSSRLFNNFFEDLQPLIRFATRTWNPT